MIYMMVWLDISWYIRLIYTSWGLSPKLKTKRATVARDGIDELGIEPQSRNEWLVGGLEYGIYDFPETVGNFIIPTDKLHHYSEGLVETTKQMAISWGYSRMSSCYNGIVWHCIPNCRILQDKNGGVP